MRLSAPVTAVALGAMLLAVAGAQPDKARTIRVALTTDAAVPLSKGDVLANVDGQKSPVLAVHGPKDDLMLILVLDLTEDISNIELAKAALISAINQLPANVYVGVMRAQDGLQVLVDPTADREAVQKAILSLPVSGRAGLLESIEPVAQLGDRVLTKASIRLAALYVTDSDIYNYREDFTNPVVNTSDYRDLSRRFPEGLVREKVAKLETSLTSYQTPIYIVHLAYRTDRLNEAYQSGLLQLAGATGGSAIFCRSRPEIAPAITSVGASIGSQYMIDLQLPEKVSKNIQIEFQSEGRVLNYRTRFIVRER